MDFEVRANRKQVDGKLIDCFAVVDISTANFPLCCQNYDTEQDAYIGLMEWERVDGINEAIAEALEELEERLCHEFGVGDIDPCRKLIKDFVRYY
jgi:hypothetical protein